MPILIHDLSTKVPVAQGSRPITTEPAPYILLGQIVAESCRLSRRDALRNEASSNLAKDVWRRGLNANLSVDSRCCFTGASRLQFAFDFYSQQLLTLPIARSQEAYFVLWFAE